MSKVYSLVRKWVDVHELGSEFVQQIEVDYLFDLLEGSIPDSITAHQVCVCVCMHACAYMCIHEHHILHVHACVGT